jgi:hypothetical protein
MTQLRHTFIVSVIMLIAWVPSSYGQSLTLSSYDISDSELDQRLKFIELRLGELNPRARYWQYGWTGFYAGTAVGQVALAIDQDDNDDQTSYTVGAVKSAAGLAQMLIKP